MKQIYAEGPEATKDEAQETTALAYALEGLCMQGGADPFRAAGALVTTLIAIVKDCPDGFRPKFSDAVVRCLTKGLEIQATMETRVTAVVDFTEVH